VKFEWDPRKGSGNARKHRVTFDEAMTVFADWNSVTIPDPEHSDDEERFIILGLSSRGRVLVVSPMDRGDNVRIINARRANARERREYGKQNKTR
jgi:uncharacterized DUF497 family protein